MEAHKITIVGAGLGGSLLAIYLARRGYEVQVYERRGDLRREPIEPGRSIKLTLAERGLAALRELGLEEEVKTRLCVPLRGRAVHSRNGTVVYQPYGKNEREVIHAFSRNDLNGFLLDVAEREPTLRLHFNYHCVNIDKETATAVFRNPRRNHEVQAQADLLVGSDGAFSVVRQTMQRRERTDYRQDFLPWGYKELTLLASAPGLPALDPNALHLWPCGDQFFFALPNLDGSLCGICVLPFSGEESWETLRTNQEILALFRSRFADALPYLPNAIQEFRVRPVSEFITIRTSRWHYKDKVVLVGDAAHSVVPFYGQGMNAAFEDAAILNRLLDEHGCDWQAILPRYQELRKPNTDVLAELSIENFHELRDTVRQPIVTARKRISISLNRLFRQHSMPLYTMISHTTTPYAECVERHRRQERIARWLGLDLLVALVSLWVRIRILYAKKANRGAASGQAVAPTVALPLPALDPEPALQETKENQVLIYRE